MLFDDESGYPSFTEAVEALRTVIGATREQIDRLDRECKELDGIDHLGVPAGYTEMLGFYLSRERITPHHTLFVLARVFRCFGSCPRAWCRKAGPRSGPRLDQAATAGSLGQSVSARLARLSRLK